MSKPRARRKAMTAAGATLLTFSLGVALAVLVAGSASAKTAPKKSPKGTAPKSQTQSATTTTPTGADAFSVVNGTANAASDHEIVGSSAFPNYTTGAVDNYYTMAHTHVDNSPFAEGMASPFDTGPIGQTAAAGNFQQPQYADARWPGGPDTAAYGNQGGPYAATSADNNRAKADASEPSNGLSGPGLHGTRTLAVPKGFDSRLQQALAAWNTKYGRGVPKPAPAPGPSPAPPVTVPSAPVKPPASPPVTVPKSPVAPPAAPKLPSAGAMGSSRSLAALTTPRPPSPPKPKASSGPGDGESLLQSSTLTALVYKTDGSKTTITRADTCETSTVGGAGTTTTATTTTADKKSGTCELVTRGESSLGRVVLGGGQIVIDGIHVKAAITNDGTNPTYTASVSVASATIGGIPVTIDQKGVHVAGQGQGAPYKQASDALNTALKQAGIQIFLVSPEVTSCPGSAGTGTTTTTTASTTTTSTDQSSGGSDTCGQTGAAGSCDQSGSSSGGAPGLPAPPTSTQSSTTTTPSPCGGTASSSTCDQAGTGTYGGTTTSTTTTSAAPPTPAPTPSTTTNQSTTSTAPTSCDQTGTSGSGSSCSQASTPTGTTPTSTDQSATSPSSGSNGMFQFGPGPGTNNAGETTVTATGVHIVFTQPTSPPGVPAQFVEHILGEVFVDSIAAPFAPLPSGGLGFSAGGSSFSPSSSSSCSGGSGHSGSRASGGGLAAGGSGSSIAGSSGSAGTAGGSLAASGSSLGAASQPISSSGSTPGGVASLPARFASALHKPLWLLLAYLAWQLLVIGTGWSLWNWRRGGAS